MRLTCPNCGAQYEVADSAIPARGRDVQCSSCGHAWFERPSDAAVAKPVLRPAPKPPSLAAAMRAGREQDDEAEADAPIQTPAKRELDPAVAEILRAEATREARERRQEAGAAFEAQQEFALDPEPDHDSMDSPPTDVAVHPTAAPKKRRSQVPRRDLLPDIEEINSSLRAKSVLRASAAEALTEEELEERARRGRGFRMGFSSILLVVLFALLLYSYADRIVVAAPGLRAPVEVYVDQINALRLWLDGQMANGARAISGVLQGAGN
ncbi:zinc-ribbon domain-containing protein [Tropicimonas sp. S265A]|uniref:zinc-ribbon domain-containing protein n=1 Tax=Tropicimonas sp. S265A TaxID=3415134 RepID=UPI003C7D9DAA